jgi:hypothetical protein
VPSAYEWAVLRAVPRVDRSEFVNVGVVVYCQALGFLEARVVPDLGRVVALDAEVDVDGLRSHLEGVRALCAGLESTGENGRRSPGERFRWIVAPRSTVVQPSPVHTGITDAPAEELNSLFDRMVPCP